jgi:hypothetical protein
MRIHDDGLSMVLHGHVEQFLYDSNDVSVYAYVSAIARVNARGYDHDCGCICALSSTTCAYDHRANGYIPYGHAIFIHDGDLCGHCDRVHGCRKIHGHVNDVLRALNGFSYGESENNYDVLLHANHYVKHS